MIDSAPWIVGIGEILWDVFPDGRRFGGAPCNFACSAAELALDRARVSLVSSVGNDGLGARAIESLEQHGVDVSLVQASSAATGQVIVELDHHGKASYRFVDDCAWDRVGWSTSVENAAHGCDAVCFGTLGQRGQISRDTIRRFLGIASQRPEVLRVLDVNLRPPFYDFETIQESLTLAIVLNLNDEELPTLAEMHGLAGSESSVVQSLMKQYSLRLVALTRGAHGATLITNEEWLDTEGREVRIVDTVGAGDAFTAAMVLGLLNAMPLRSIGEWAGSVAAFVCSVAGGTTTFPNELRDGLISRS